MGQINPTLPTAGSTLNSVADPQLITALTQILGVINGGIDPTNLSAAGGVMRLAARTLTVTGAANAGDLVTASPGITVTLPAPAANALVAVRANGSVTGASPVMVSGTAIQGVGLSSASSFLLGTPGAGVLLQSDGSSWFVIAGQQDTGWVALAFTAGFGALAGSYTPAARLIGDRVFLRGGVINNSAGSWGAAAFATVPSGLRPASTVYGPQLYAGGGGTFPTTQLGLSVVAGGGISATSSFGGNTAATGLDGFSYALS